MLAKALNMIGTHLDEDENTARALQHYLGMNEEEIAECGFLPAQNLEAHCS